jgi:hypothetical protein
VPLQLRYPFKGIKCNFSRNYNDLSDMVFFYSSIQGLQRGIVDLGKDDKVNDL